jgi:hypothetical protein
LAIAVARFKYLSRQFYHLPSRNASDEHKRLHLVAQQELWNLAQAICGQVQPLVQRRLDDVRRVLVTQLHIGVHNGILTGAGVVTTIAKRPFSWHEVQLTPELMHDPALSGLAVLPEDVKKLKAAMRAQGSVLRSLSP